MKMLINGKKVDSSDGKVAQVSNPATLEVIDDGSCRNTGGC